MDFISDEEKYEKAYCSHKIKSIEETELLFFVPGLIPQRGNKRHEAKNGQVCVTIHRHGLSLELLASVKDSSSTKEVTKRYKGIIKRFPSAVVNNRCEWEVRKGGVHVLLRKAEKIDWTPFIEARGLDQQGSSSENSDEEGAVAAAAKPKPNVYSLGEFFAKLTATYETNTPIYDESSGRQVARVIKTVFTEETVPDDLSDEQRRRRQREDHKPPDKPKD